MSEHETPLPTGVAHGSKPRRFSFILASRFQYHNFMSKIRKSRYLYHKPIKRPRLLAMDRDPRIQVCRTNLTHITSMLRTAPQDRRNYLSVGRATASLLDATGYLQRPAVHITEEQIGMVATLERLACGPEGSGNREAYIADLAAWCSRSWLTLLARERTNYHVLRALGQSWLARAQPILARIHRAENSWSSSAGSGSQQQQPSASGVSFALWDDDGMSGATTAEAERRAGLEDYVEARGFLMPATDYLDRAVAAARQQRRLEGELLVMTAEAYMSLGNTSSPRVSEPYLRRALYLLRDAAATPKYTLSQYLQQYLDDYGRFID